MRIGIVGHEAAKFTPEAERAAREIIRSLLVLPGVSEVVSGGCHLGGIDIWAEEEADAIGLPKRVHRPAVLSWGAPGGFKDRNLQIAAECDVVHCIVVDKLPEGWAGMRFPQCYHCRRADHVKSGGCWTMLKAKSGQLHIVENGATG